MNLEFRITQRQLSIVFLILYSIFYIPLTAHAQAPLVPCTGINCTVDDLFQLLVNIYNFLLGLAALVAMLFIIWGGVRMLYFSYLEGSDQELKDAKLTVRRAVGGFVIIALAYLIVSTVLTMLGVSSSGPLADLLRGVGLLK